jgi:cell surface protein SprA
LRLKLVIVSIIGVIGQLFSLETGPVIYDLDVENQLVALDTIPLNDRYDDFISDPSTNPFDIKPSNLEQQVEYDPVTDRYLIFEKIGEEYYRTPTYMTFEEYVKWQNEQQDKAYFQNLAGISGGYKSKSGIVDPISKIDIQNNLVDRLFGGTEVDIQPQGNIDLTFGGDYQKTLNPNLDTRQQTRGGFDFDMNIKMNVDGQIGKKMKLGFNYDTQATFDFDRKIKLEYDTEEFSEDDIIKTIEAGNVSLPLRSSLIQGAQSLFGLKTELQFGKLRLSLLASQQRSQTQSVQTKNGSTLQDIEIRPDEYDENRHFFISHYHRDTYESTLSSLPFLDTPFRMNNIQVWVSDDRPDYQLNSTTICAIGDLAEPDVDKYSNENAQYDPTNEQIGLGRDGFRLPYNGANELYLENGLATDDMTRRKDNTSSMLRSSQYNLTQTRDFEVFRGRLLNSSEYTYSPELGFISLNVRLKPNQVLGVSYDYYFVENCDTLYKVGELSDESLVSDTDTTGLVQPESVVYVKMLKSSNQRVDHPTWDLMMKNVYPMRTSNLDRQNFEFDIFYENDTLGILTKFLPVERDMPLLNLFQLDRLNSFGDPQADGVFDYVPGVTIIERTATVVFPVLEPFGSSLDELLPDPADAEFYKFQELYDTTVVIARQSLEKNKFVMQVKVESSSSSEISLGAWNIPQGSVRVTAGGDLLQEGVDYEVDYGIGKVRIINPAYLQSGVPINASFEDNSVFSLQQKTMLGMRADYEVSEKLNFGATYLRLFERPFTQKVNIGDDPINNRVFGLDMNYSSESEALTRIVDKLPFYSTKEPSNFNFSAEVAALRPGHNGAINLPDEDEGAVSIDDFEGAINGFPLGSQVNRWFLASVPDTFPEANLVDNLANGSNRANLSWYVLDLATQATEQDNTDPYSRIVDQRQFFNRELAAGQLANLRTFDLGYRPDERGPYNFDTPDGYPGISSGLEYDPNEQRFKLRDPESRWAGVMRYFNNNDFEAANYEFIEFWILNPYIDIRDKQHEAGERGKIEFHLGNVSEDILNDNQQFFENTIPEPGEEVPIAFTALADVPLTSPTNNAFDLENRELQDLGLDGLNDNGERVKFDEWLQTIGSAGLDRDIQEDPANDNYVFFNDEIYTDQNTVFDRYSKFSNPQGNAPDGTQNERGNPFPDSEDLNNNFSLDEGESYYKYVLELENEGGRLNVTDNPFIVGEIVPDDATHPDEVWYQVRIPLNSPTQNVNEIQGFRSIQFMRLIVDDFATEKTLRLAEFEMVRSQWRRAQSLCYGLPADTPITEAPDDLMFSVDDIGVEENSDKLPFNYISPKGIVQERLFSSFANVLQDEKAMALNFCNLRANDSCEVAINKLTELDMRRFKRLQMFVHAENVPGVENIDDDDVSIFLRIGKDYINNYYEYEIPLKLSENADMSLEESDIVWREENMFDFPLELFTELKKERNLSGELVLNSFDGIDPEKPENTIRIKGNPNLGFVKGFQVGIRVNGRRIDDNPPSEGYCGQVWINELRASGLEEGGGIAGLARMDMQLADLGNLSASGSYSSIGWGGLDQRLQERSFDQVIEYDLASNLELGKFLPNKWNVSVPFYAQFSKSIRNPKYDPYDIDLTVDEKIDIASTPEEVDEIKSRSQDVTTIRTVNLTNVRKQRGNPSPTAEKKKPSTPKPWDIENVSASYSFTETQRRDPILKSDNATEYRFGLNYDYSRKSKFLQPFKKIAKSKLLKFVKEINFNPLPNSFSFGNELNRYRSEREFREPASPVFKFNDQRFNWVREYDLRWDLTKALKLTFNATNESVIDEYRQVGISADPVDRDWVDEVGQDVTAEVRANPDAVKDYRNDNLRDFGRNKNYSHNLQVSYTVPMKNIPGFDWVNLKGQYKSNYAWTAGSLTEINGSNLGNMIQNSQNRSMNATFNFDKLYDKIPYLKGFDKKTRKSSRRKDVKRTSDPKQITKEDLAKDGKSKKKERTGKSLVEKILVRPLMMLRKVDISYREDFYTIIPGFTPETEYFGLSNGFDAPGWNFVLGLQPDITFGDRNNYLFQAAERGWISNNRALNQQVIQDEVRNYTADIDIEPWKDLRIDVNFKKNYRKNHTEQFKNKSLAGDPDNFEQLAFRDLGSFEVSYMSLGTLFQGSDAQINDLFTTFENNRQSVSARLENDPNAGIHSLDGQDYAQGYGRLSSEVLVPSFLAAYTGKDIDGYDVNTDLEEQVSSSSYIPLPNWRLSYKGLSKLDKFKELFSSFSIEHGYSSTLKVSNFINDPEYNFEDPFASTKLVTGNYFSRIEIPAVIVDERFEPLLGVSMKTKNEMNLDFKYSKNRQLGLSVANAELLESRGTEVTFGMGYTFKNVNIGFLTGDKGNKKRSRRDKDKDDDKADDKDDKDDRRRGRRGNVNDQRGRDLLFSVDFALRDDVTYRHQIDSGTQAEPTRGSRTISINPALDYDVNENFTIRMFVDYSKRTPYISTGFPTTSVEGGITMRFNLN